MNTKEVAELTGVSVRTLHHYDEIGLLCPKRNGNNGYRQYYEEDLDVLQQILFFKECGFPLTKIQELLECSTMRREDAFELQRKALLYEKLRIETMLDTLDKSMLSMKGKLTMSSTDKFKGFNMGNNPYEVEARKLWGNEVVDESHRRISSLNQEEQNQISEGMNQLFLELALISHEDLESNVVQEAMTKMYDYFNQNFGYHYSLEAFATLGEMYVNDQRFSDNLNQYGEGLAEFLAKSMKIYANQHK